MQGAHDEYYYIYHLLFRRVDLDSFFCLTSLSALFAFKIFAFLVYQVMISILSLSYPSNHQLTEDPNPPPYNPNDYPMAMVMETYRMVQMTMVCLALVIHNTMNPSIQTQAKMNALLSMFLSNPLDCHCYPLSLFIMCFLGAKKTRSMQHLYLHWR
eukprot:650698_1